MDLLAGTASAAAPVPAPSLPYGGGFGAGLGGGGGNGADFGMAAHVADLTRQLAAQMDYNNELLAQLQRLEENHLVYQKGAQEKQAALRQALAVADAARAEVNDVKRRLAIAQEVSGKLSDELKDCRVENGSLRRQVEALEKLATDARAEIGTLRADRADVASRADMAAREASGLKAALRDAEARSEEAVSELTGKVTALTEALAQARSKLGPMSADIETSRTAAAKLRDEAEEAKRSRADALARLDHADAAIASLDSAVRELRANEARLVRALEEEAGKVASLQAAAAKDAQLLALKDTEVMAAAQKAGDATAEMRRAVEEREALSRQAEALAVELHNQERGRAAERDHYEARLREAMEDVRRIADEARMREGAHAAHASRRADEVIAARRAAEEQLNAAQADLAQLHEMVSALRAEKAAQSQAFDVERAEAERRLAEAQHRAALAGEAAGKTENELRAQNVRLAAQVHQLDEAVAAADQRHGALLASMQAALKVVRTEAEAVRGSYTGLLAATRVLHGRITESLSAQQGPLSQWYEEVQRAFLFLMDGAEEARKSRGEALDRLRGCEVALEEARSQGLMLEESLSRMEHEVSAKGARITELTALLEARDAAAGEAARSAAAVNADLSSEVARLRVLLDKANKTHVALQAEVARSQNDLEEAQGKARARVAALEAQISALQGEQRGAAAGAEALLADKARLNDTVAGQAAALEQLRRELKATQTGAEQAAEAARGTVGAYAAQVSSLGETVKRLDGQLKQTQSLLAVVQEQRRTLQENNIALRAELDERYKASLIAAASGVGAGASPSTFPTASGPAGFATSFVGGDAAAPGATTGLTTPSVRSPSGRDAAGTATLTTASMREREAAAAATAAASALAATSARNIMAASSTALADVNQSLARIKSRSALLAGGATAAPAPAGASAAPSPSAGVAGGRSPPAAASPPPPPPPPPAPTSAVGGAPDA